MINKYKIILILTSVFIMGVFLLWRELEYLKYSNKSNITNISLAEYIYENNKNSVVSILHENNNIIWTSFLFNSEYILTNKHVLDNNEIPNKQIKVIIEDKIYTSEIVIKDNIYDFTVLKINNPETKLNYLKISNSDIKVWQEVYSIWNLWWNLQKSISKWIITWLNRNIEWYAYKFIETDLDLWNWESGSPLFNNKWEVIWINTLILDQTSKASFSIPVYDEDIKYFYNFLKSNEFSNIDLNRWNINFEFDEINSILKNNLDLDLNYWVLVLKEYKNLKSWDIIYKINNQEVRWNIYELIRFKNVWEEIRFEILRWWENISLDYRLD